MTGPREPLDQPAQTTAGGWPDAPQEELQGDVGWPQPADDDDSASDDGALEAWLAERDAATAGPEPLAAQEPVAAPEPVVEVASPAHEPPAAPAEAPPDDGPDPQQVEPAGVLQSGTTDLGDEHTAVVEEAPEAVEPSPRSARTLVLAGVLALLLGLDVFLAVASVRTRGLGADEEGRRDAVAAARNAARLVFSYDYRKLDKDFAAGLATTTGDFRDEYTRTTGALKKAGLAGKLKAVVVADVSDAAVVTGDSERAEVLVFLDQQSTSTDSAPQITTSRVVMRMRHTAGGWLVEKIKAL